MPLTVALALLASVAVPVSEAARRTGGGPNAFFAAPNAEGIATPAVGGVLNAEKTLAFGVASTVSVRMRYGLLGETHSPCASRACLPLIRVALVSPRTTSRGGVAMVGQGHPSPAVLGGSEKAAIRGMTSGTMCYRRRQRTRAKLRRPDRPTPHAPRRRCSSWAELNGKRQGPMLIRIQVSTRGRLNHWR